MTTFTFKINATEVVDRVETLDEELKATVAGTINKIHWELTGVDGDKSISHAGVVDAEIKCADLAKVKEADLIKEVKSALGKEFVKAEEAKIEEQLNPTE